MSAPQWLVGAGLIGQLLAHPYRFEFAQAMRLLGGLDGCRVRFRNRLSLAFPPSEVAAIDVDAEGVTITPAFMGLLGANGAMPASYTERIAAHEHAEGDPAARAFLDLLLQRPLALFHEAWALHRPECHPAAFQAMLQALAGTLPTAMPGAIPTAAPVRYAAQLRSRAVPAATVAGVLTEYFGVPVRVEQLVPAWETLPPEDQASLGKAHVALDSGVLLGARLLRCDTLARIHVGPLCREEFERFLPRRDGAEALQAMLGMFCGGGQTCEVRVALRAADVRGASLHAQEGQGGARLGVNAFVLSNGSTEDRDDLRYYLHP